MNKHLYLILFLSVLLPTAVYGAEPTPKPATITEDAKSLFEKAQRYFKEQNYKGAKDILGGLVEKHPMEGFVPKAKLLLAGLEEDFNASIAQFKALAKEYNDRPEGEEAQRDLSARYFLADRYQEAAQGYREFLQKHPKSPSVPEARYWYASSLSALGQDKEAVEEYKRVVHDAPDSPWAPKSLLGLGNSYSRMGRFGDAEKAYLRILDQYHLAEELNLVYFKLGEAYQSDRRPKEAHAAYETLIDRYPRSLEVRQASLRLAELERQYPELPKSALAARPEPTPTMVAVETVPTPSRPAATPPPAPQTVAPSASALVPGPFHVQVGVYTKWKYLAKARKDVKKAGFETFVVSVKREGLPYTCYKVRVGNFRDHASAEVVAGKLSKKLKQKAIVVEDK